MTYLNVTSKFIQFNIRIKHVGSAYLNAMARINFNKIGRSQISCQSVTSKNKTILDPRFSDDNKFNLILKNFGLYKLCS